MTVPLSDWPRPWLKRARAPICALLFSALCVFVSSGAQLTAEWIATGYADWTNAANWKNGIVPKNSLTDQYTVILDLPTADFTQSALTDPMSLSQLTLGNVLYVYSASGVGSVEFDVRDNFDWVGGSLSGWAAQYHLYGDALFEGATYKTLDRTCALTMHGHSRWTQGNLSWGGYGVVTNTAGALFELLTGGSIGSVATTDSADVYNEGTILMNAPGQVAQFYNIVHHSGLLDLEAGDVQFVWKYGGPGAITVQSGAHVIFSGPNQWQTVPQSGGGQLIFSGREQELVSDTIFAISTVIGADFFGNGNLTLSNAVWQGGQMTGPGNVTVPSGGTLTIQGQTARLGRDMVNNGGLFLAPNAWLNGGSATTTTNTGTGQIHLASGAALGLSYSPAGVLINLGNILKDDSALGPASIFSSVQNFGLIRSTGGRLRLGSGGSNAGTIQALGAGQIETDGLDFADSSMLIGDGQVWLVGGTLRGSIDTNLNLITSQGVSVLGTNLYLLKSLQSSGTISFPQSGGADIWDTLILNGSLNGGLLRSGNKTELSLGNSSLQNSAHLELLGQSAFVQGSLTIQDTNSTLLNSGSLHGVGSSDLLVNSGGLFQNQGTWQVTAQMGSFKSLLTSSLCRFSTANPSTNATLADGPFFISGPMSATAAQLVAGPGANLSLSDLAATNATISLRQSALTVTSTLTTSNATVALDQSTIACPSNAWTGSAIVRGQGSIEGALALKSLELDASTKTNDLIVNGALSVTGSNALLRVSVALTSQGTPAFPHMQVHGPVALDANFDLVAAFAPGPSNFAVGPITLLESDQSIAGAFLNVTNGAILSTLTNSYRFAVFYGPNSPYGANKVVIAQFGTAFDRWRMQRFNSAQLQDPAVSGPMADPDHIGLNNLTAFVLGVDSAVQAGTLPSITPGPNGYTVIHLRRRKDVGGLQTVIAVSSDLVTWKETLLGAPPTWMDLHRVFDLGTVYDYTYLYPGTPRVLFLKTSVDGNY